MRIKPAISLVLLAAAMLLELNAGAGAKTAGSKDPPSAAPPAAAANATQSDDHVEGERRFRSNCGRCHTAPPKFPPRMMATIIRHMRVRANITDQEMRLILRYMSE